MQQGEDQIVGVDPVGENQPTRPAATVGCEGSVRVFPYFPVTVNVACLDPAPRSTLPTSSPSASSVRTRWRPAGRRPGPRCRGTAWAGSPGRAAAGVVGLRSSGRAAVPSGRRAGSRTAAARGSGPRRRPRRWRTGALLDSDVLACRSAVALIAAGDPAVQVVGDGEQDLAGAVEGEPEGAARGQVVPYQCPQVRRSGRVPGHRGPPADGRASDGCPSNGVGAPGQVLASAVSQHRSTFA